MPGLEDDFCDIIGKARRGLGLGAADAASGAGLTASRLAELESGSRPREDEVRGLAGRLGLNATALLDIAAGAWLPALEPPAGVDLLPVGVGYAANAWIVETAKAGEVDVVDPGAEAELLLSRLGKRRIRFILLTHAHGDHIGAVEVLQVARGGIVCLHGRERAPFRALPPETAEVGGWEIIELPGHTPGSVAYLSRGRLFCGDALFAGSIGRSFHSYAEHLESLRKRVMTLPPETLLLPGHGPLTSVALEGEHNPYLA